MKYMTTLSSRDRSDWNFIPRSLKESFQIYVPIASLTTTVPVLSCGGLTKRFLVPGWRMGWIVMYDRNHVFDHHVEQVSCT